MARPKKITKDQIKTARDILWRNGQLSWKLRPGQNKMLDCLYAPNTLAVFNVSRRFGKSTVCAIFCVENAIRKKQHVKFATAFLTDLEQFILPIFDDILSDCPQDIKPTYLASKKEYRFPNGSVIKLIGTDKSPNSLRGRAVDILIMDEAGFISKLEYLYRSVISPATADRQFKLVFISTPPESPEHFFAKELIPKAKSTDSYVELTMDDNLYYSQQEKERLYMEAGGIASSNCQREYFCRIQIDTNRAIAPSFTKDHIKPVSPDYINWQYFGDTGGIRDKTVFLKVGFDHNTRLIIFRDELVYDNNTVTTKIIEGFKSKFGDKQTITLDASGQLILDYSAAGLQASLPQKDDFAAGLLLLNNHFYLNQAIIHPDCKLFIRTLEGGLLTKNRNDYERSESLGHCDAIAAAIYALRGVDKSTDLRPKPSRQNMWIIETPDKNINNIKQLGYFK